MWESQDLSCKLDTHRDGDIVCSEDTRHAYSFKCKGESKDRVRQAQQVVDVIDSERMNLISSVACNSMPMHDLQTPTWLRSLRSKLVGVHAAT